MNYSLSKAAVKDIRGIVLHILTVQQSPQNAALVAVRLRNHFRRLVAMPYLGYPRAQLQDADARVSEITGLVVIYDATSRPLVILRVVHAARDLSRIRPR